ncbi:hypothetical protein BD626DRAFT_170114 [Schizophyllum amplum]|uniref:Uncharacterized protein n=1 Tax=Schizophyllum amplum TaxID=97359 RepID=A0A550CQU4_9AGAR|nr:hypothetical protein BD626DRAFT_170114 [Auriculariopsis ampla]
MAQRQQPRSSVNPTGSRGHGAPPALTQQQIERQGWLTTADAYRGLDLSTQPLYGPQPAVSYEHLPVASSGHPSVASSGNPPTACSRYPPTASFGNPPVGSFMHLSFTGYPMSSASTGTPVYSSSTGYAESTSSSSSPVYSLSATSPAYSSSASFLAYPASSTSGYSLSSPTPMNLSSGNAPFVMRQASFSTTRSSFEESDEQFLPGLPSASSSPLSTSRPSMDQQMHAPTSAAPSHEAKFKYIASRNTGGGRDVLKRIDDMSANPDIKSFGPYHITCAGCGRAISTRRGIKIYRDTEGSWEYHQTACSVLQQWKNPSSSHKLTAEMRAALKQSRMVSKENALAHLLRENQIVRVQDL